jgi:hypothetical protein
MNWRKLMILVVAAMTAASGVAHASDAEIERLLKFVGTSGCSFERNGSMHAPAEAEAHLRRKLAAAKGRITDASAFIDRVASKSSWTGRAYRVDCADQEMLARDWLYAELQRIRAYGE